MIGRSSARAPPTAEAAEASEGASRIIQQKISRLTAGSGRGGRSMALDLAEQVVFEGTLKSFNPSTHTGFIDCSVAKELFGRDLSVHGAMCHHISVGAAISFRIQMQQGQPRAYDVRSPPVRPERPTPRPLREETPPRQPVRRGPAEPRSDMAALLAQSGSSGSQRAAPPREGAFSTSSEMAALLQCSGSVDSGTFPSGMIPQTEIAALLANAHKNEADPYWMPSIEASERTAMAALRAHNAEPETYPVPQVRKGAFVGWRSD